MNRLTGITLENFKAFKKRQYIPIRPLTLIFGPNSAGKSSIVQALALIRHAFYNKGYAEADRVDMGWSEIRLGGWQNLVHAHDSAATFKIGMHFDFIDSSVIDSKSLGSPVSTDYWEVTWEFGRVREDTEAYVMSCSAVKNGSPEFKGTRCSTKPTIWNLEFSSCVPKKAEFVSMLIKYAGAQLPKRYRCKFQAWANATISEDAVFGGLFPGAILPDERKKEEYSYNVYSITPKDYIESLLNPNDCLYPLGDNEPFGPHVALASAIRSITEGTQPSVETANRIKILWNDWIDHHAIYDRVARFFENIANNHLHLDSVRERPAHQLNRRDLPSIPKNKPWLHLIENEQSRNSVNTSLRTLTSPNYYKLVERKTTNTVQVEKPDEPTRIEFVSTTNELAFQNENGLTFSPHDIGYGISTVLPIIVALKTSNRSIVSVEQPELHVHPCLQAGIGDLLVESAFGNIELSIEYYTEPGNNTLIIETHSEHLILRILRRIRETTAGELDEWPESLRKACPNGILPKDVAVLYVEPNQNGSSVKNLRINELGEFIDEWPNGFFDERIKEIF